MRRHLLISCMALATLGQAADAQVSTPVEQRSIWELFSFDAFAHRMVQSAIVAARTQADITFENLSTNPFTSELALTGLGIWPVLPYDQDFNCEIKIDRLSLASVPFDHVSEVAGTADAIGVTITPECLPPDAAQVTSVLKASGVETLSFDRVHLHFDYDLPSAAAKISIEVSNQDLASINALLNFSYLSLEIRDDDTDPNPIMFLTDGRIEVEDRGAWAIASKMMGEEVPPAVLATMLSQQMTQGLAGMNGDDPSLNAEQEAFVLSAGNTVTSFLNKPGRIVLEIDPMDGEVFIDTAKLENPKELFSLLRPTFSTRAKVRNEVLTSRLLQLANDPSTEGFSDEDRMTAGRAIITGVGAPKLANLGAEILRPLADAGNGEAALLVANALANKDPATAYRFAIIAGAANETAALGLMDKLESKLALPDVIAIQSNLIAEPKPLAGITRLSELREASLAHLNGKGVTRSYPMALYWARLSAAASDDAATAILRSLNQRAAAMGKAGTSQWAEVAAKVDRAALGNWVKAQMGEKIASGEIN